MGSRGEKKIDGVTDSAKVKTKENIVILDVFTVGFDDYHMHNYLANIFLLKNLKISVISL